MLLAGEVDVGIASEMLANNNSLAAFPGSAGIMHCWSRAIMNWHNSSRSH